ncbi:hypothetical protein [Ostreibacterium oceani]|uniref:Uncharacterized protein n=1 Tax=Ostreibacterium oceani TaxID=2654998 RepID=A0A6N7ETF5_9GAMM|nr:hypothetical protein [Ostreibacterium oceani]MPV85712.1 hypothetical protein [Ostreibacterium oceani]
MKIGTQLKQWLVLSLALMTVTAVQAFEPVTGVWSDTGEGQRRTGYSIEFQNGFMLMSIYSYADNNASTNPTWYNTEGFLTKNEDGSLSGTFPLYTVANNQLPNAEGNVPAGNMTIRFTDRETATVTWNNFPGNRLAQSTLKKYWFIGTGTDATAKRFAARGNWQYSLVNEDNAADFGALVVGYFDPTNPENSSVYAGVDSDTLVGRTIGLQNERVTKQLFADGVDLTIIEFADRDFYFLEVGGGAEYAAGFAAIVGSGEMPTASDYRYRATAVRFLGQDHRNGSGIEKSGDLLPTLSTSDVEAMTARLKAATENGALDRVKVQLMNKPNN